MAFFTFCLKQTAKVGSAPPFMPTQLEGECVLYADYSVRHLNNENKDITKPVQTLTPPPMGGA